VLDLTSKTAVAEIHLFDGDFFSQHNAFRGPGAPTLEQLAARPKKVTHFAEVYSAIRHGVVAHDVFIEDRNISLLDGLDFVFLCLDRGPAKRLIVDRLVANGTSFIEVGMGVVKSEDGLGGIVRTAFSTSDTRTEAERHISYADDDDGANEYATNIQIAELNALNAALAVVRWKKFMGFYRDTRKTYHDGFSIASGEIVQESLA
jgi:hypothetical protein